MTAETPEPAISKPWYKKWRVWALIALGVLVAVAILNPTDESSDSAGTTTTAAQESTATTVTMATTTTQPSTTTTLPPILAEGEGSGDDVVELDIPVVPVVIEMSHSGEANFAVWSLSGFEQVDLLVNTIGDYDGTRPMQWKDGEAIAGLEIAADGAWTYEVRPLAHEPPWSCPVGGRRDAAILLENFVSEGGAADLTHNGEANFAVSAWGVGADLLVNEIGPYEGAVRVNPGTIAWDITADGDWTIDC